uniref:Protein kinase domain-containing protein n=1 Tax=Panagrolaimus sp. PS1159 TaxID=55785 RepID=A0AC35GJ63_9BILA
MTMVVEKSCHSQLPPASPLYEESLSSSLESLEIRTNPKMSNESDDTAATSPSMSSASSTTASSLRDGRGSVGMITKPLPRSVAAIAARHKFEKAPTLTCSSSEDHPSDDNIPRHASTSSLPAFPVVPSISLYEKIKLQLEEDEAVQREISLGKRIGFYRLGKELGAGNFSKVKLGVHCLTKEKVAVKVMDKSKMDQKAQRLLSREIASMELLHHPNVIRLFEVIETLSKVYLMMEYAAGGELYTYVHENGKLTEETAKPIFAQLISAVAHLHAKGIVHRDIKAENVIFSQPGWIKLADFGFSCKYEDDTHLATFCGSPPYAAPELFRDPNYHGPAVDVWALGVTLYFMLVGVTPFRGETVQILKTNIMKGTYTVPEYVSGFAQYVIQRLLCMEPHKRATILDIKKMYWLSQSKFPDSYLQISITPNESSLKTDQTEREVWEKLKEIGIDHEMIRDSAGKGAKDSIIGTYRIVLYQCQAPEHEKERNKVRSHIQRIAERNKRAEEQFTNRSKTCTIF